MFASQPRLETSPVIRTTLFSLIAIGALTAPALGQTLKDKDGVYATADDATYGDEIIVIAPGVYRDDTGRRTSSGIPIQDLTTQRAIDTYDLNLRRDADVAELHRRIRETAEEACDEIERASQGPMLTSDRECVREATREAMAQADELVLYRRGYGRG